MTTEGKVKEVVIKRSDKMVKTHINYKNNPFEPETTHKFRVNMRKARALLNFLKPTMDKEVYKELNGSLREAAKRLSPLREADVLIEEVGEQALNEPNLIDNYRDLFNFLHSERRKLLRYRYSDDILDYFTEVMNEVTEKIQALDLSLEKRDEDDWAEFVENRLNQKDRKLNKENKKADHTNYSESHEVRKKAKKVRYAASDFKNLYSSKNEAKAIKKNAKGIQKDLGTSCDLYVNAGLLRDYAEKTEDNKLKDSFEILARHQEEARKELLEEEL